MPTSCPPLHSPWQVTGAALLGGPAAGLWLIADNFGTIGWGNHAKGLRIALVIIFLALAAFAVYGPELKSYTVFGAICAALVRQYALMSYGQTYEKHLAEGGARRGHSGWILAGIIGMAVTVGAILGYVFGVGAVAPDLLPRKLFE